MGSEFLSVEAGSYVDGRGSSRNKIPRGSLKNLKRPHSWVLLTARYKLLHTARAWWVLKRSA